MLECVLIEGVGGCGVEARAGRQGHSASPRHADLPSTSVAGGSSSLFVRSRVGCHCCVPPRRIKARGDWFSRQHILLRLRAGAGQWRQWSCSVQRFGICACHCHGLTRLYTTPASKFVVLVVRTINSLKVYSFTTFSTSQIQLIEVIATYKCVIIT